jgi:hypothetical protein
LTIHPLCRKINIEGYKMGRMKKVCEICLTTLRALTESTICNDCDEILEKEQTQYFDALNAKHAAKYKCRSCKKGLPLTRARYCEDCVQEINIPQDFSDAYGNVVGLKEDVYWKR